MSGIPHAFRPMMQQERGLTINIASQGGLLHPDKMAAYSGKTPLLSFNSSGYWHGGSPGHGIL
ncbi:MAG: hypothetical protein AAF542_01015 [Pseudomonadota bacterium]